MNWSQLRTILWLRWRLTRNQLSRMGKVNAVLTMVIVALGLVVGVVGGAAGILGGAFSLTNASPLVLLLIWDLICGVFLFLWLLGVLIEIQRAEAIDLARLLALPVSLGGIFIVNYLASHFSLTLALFIPGMLGLCAGLVLSKGAAMLWLFPLVLGFLFMVTAWTYCLRGWLISLMVNPRRRSAVIAAVTLGFMILCQVPNLLVNLWSHPARRHPATENPGQTPGPGNEPAPVPPKTGLPPSMIYAHYYVPAFWVANGAMGLAQDNPWPAVGGAMAAFALGAIGLRRAYRATLRFYQGQEITRAAKALPRKEPVQVARPTSLETKLPGLREELSVLALAFFRSMLRAPEIRLALATNFIILLILTGSLVSRGVGNIEGNFKPFLATGAVAFACFGLLQSLFNQFGLDRDGFRALVLLPVPRKQILLGKNLSFLPLAAGGALVFLMLMAIIIRIPLLAVLSAMMQFIAEFLLLCVLGNFLSIIYPYRIGMGSLKPTKMPGTTKVVVLVSHLLFPLVLIPMFMPPLAGFLWAAFGSMSAGPVNLVLSLLLAAAAAAVYGLSLASLGNLLLRREQNILQLVTQEIE